MQIPGLIQLSAMLAFVGRCAPFLHIGKIIQPSRRCCDAVNWIAAGALATPLSVMLHWWLLAVENNGGFKGASARANGSPFQLFLMRLSLLALLSACF